MHSNLLQHGIMFAQLSTERGTTKAVPMAIGVFAHHGDGFLARISLGLNRDDAVRSLSNEHNPTEVVHDMEELAAFALQHGMQLTDPVGSLPEFSERMEKEFSGKN